MVEHFTSTNQIGDLEVMNNVIMTYIITSYII